MSGNFEQCSFDHWPAERLDAAMMEQGGCLGSIGYGYTLNAKPGPLAGGWSLEWIDSRGMGNHGRAVLVPTDKRTRRLWREGKLRELVRRGLKRQWAACLLDARPRFGGMLFEQAERLGRVLSECAADPAALRAMLAHPASYGSGSGRGEWWDRWDEVIPPSFRDTPSRPREAALAEMVQHVLWTCRT